LGGDRDRCVQRFSSSVTFMKKEREPGRERAGPQSQFQGENVTGIGREKKKQNKRKTKGKLPLYSGQFGGVREGKKTAGQNT